LFQFYLQASAKGEGVKKKTGAGAGTAGAQGASASAAAEATQGNVQRRSLSLARYSKSDYPRAAVKVLKAANRIPMHYKDIGRAAAEQQLINASSQSMMTTMFNQVEGCCGFLCHFLNLSNPVSPAHPMH